MPKAPRKRPKVARRAAAAPPRRRGPRELIREAVETAAAEEPLIVVSEWDDGTPCAPADEAAAEAIANSPPSALAVCIVKLRSDPNERSHLGTASLEDATQTHDVAPGRDDSVQGVPQQPAPANAPATPPSPFLPDPRYHLWMHEIEPATPGAPFHICSWHPEDGWCQVRGCYRRAGSFRVREAEAQARSMATVSVIGRRPEPPSLADALDRSMTRPIGQEEPTDA